MRHTRRSTRVSYTEPPANLDDLQLDDDHSNENNGILTRTTRHNLRRNRDLAELELQKQQIEQEPMVFIRPTKRSRHDFIKSKDFNWRDYVSEDVLSHVDKTNLPELPINNPEILSLVETWYYQFVMSWFNNVCNSYITTVLNNIKPLWKDIKFDEILFLNELTNTEIDENSLTNTLRLKLLRLLMNTKKVELMNWDDLIIQQLNNYHPLHSYIDKFTNLPLTKQFEIYYYIIKIIEIKSMTFKNYLNNNLNIFNFPTLQSPLDNTKQIMIMPTHGCIVEINTITNSTDSKLVIPIKLSNCTIKKESLNETELIHLDYSQEIDSYLNSIKIDYIVKSWDWSTFNEFIVRNEHFQDWLLPFIEIKMTHLLYSSKLIIQDAKTKQIAELMSRRKRSSRLVAREEETKKKEINDLIHAKYEERNYFLKNRHRSLAKYNKRLKDIIWNLLWVKFDQDLNLIKLQNKTTLKNLINPGEKLTPNDIKIINHGAYFTRSIIDISDESMYLHKMIMERNNPLVEEIPKELCFTTRDIEKSRQNNIELNNITQPDNQDWIFHCICDDSTLKVFNNSNEDEIINISSVYNHKLICCDLCHIWEHWDCQPQENIDYLSQMHVPIPKKGAPIEPIKPLNEKDFAIVILGKLTAATTTRHNLRESYNDQQDDEHSNTYRRSARLAEVEHERVESDNEENDEGEQHSLLRPTDLRSRYGQSSPYICGFCMKLLERELRSVFTPELELTRFKQRKGHDDRERRKQKKLAKEKAQALERAKLQSIANVNAPNNAPTFPNNILSQRIVNSNTPSTIIQPNDNNSNVNG